MAPSRERTSRRPPDSIRPNSGSKFDSFTAIINNVGERTWRTPLRAKRLTDKRQVTGTPSDRRGMMPKSQFLPKFAAVLCVVAAAALLAFHVNAWFLTAPEQGSHLQGDFVQAGFTFTLAQRIAGALLEGLPKIAFAMALFTMFPLLWRQETEVDALKRGLSRASTLLLAGSALLLIYPSLASLAFSWLEPGEVGVFLVSLPPVVSVAVIGSLLFAATASRMRVHLHSPQD